MCEDELYYWGVDLLKEMIQTPSLSRNESDVVNILEQKLSALNLSFERSGNNIWTYAHPFDSGKKTLLLNSHIDTVKPSSDWSKNPFGAEEEEDILWGLGSNDAGASVVSLLCAFLLLKKRDLPYNLIFSATAEEEVSGEEGIASVLPLLPDIDLAIVGEPTRMQLAISEKGLVVIDGYVKGKSGHAARNEGVNAIYEALPVIAKLKDLRFPKVSPLLGEVKATMTIVQAGSQHNVVPDRFNFTLDVRTNECYTNEEAFEYLQKELGCELKARSFRLNSSGIDLNHPIVERARLLGLECFGSPTLSDQSRMPFTSVKIGPGDSARSHTADEYIRKSEIREGIDVYVRLLKDLKI
ncbi:MAG: M20 family metallo-hydrolase [Bacteroidales bacterium]